jgi:hypothetical protein
VGDIFYQANAEASINVFYPLQYTQLLVCVMIATGV